MSSRCPDTTDPIGSRADLRFQPSWHGTASRSESEIINLIEVTATLGFAALGSILLEQGFRP
jgi:hypothetical protein